MDWSSLSEEIIGGIVTAVAVAAGLRLVAAKSEIGAHAIRVAELDEDLRRWLPDRDRQLARAIEAQKREDNRHNLVGSGQHAKAVADLRAAALHEWRDEATRKRRTYRAIRDAEGFAHRFLRTFGEPFPSLTVSDDQRRILASWRVPGRPLLGDGTPAIEVTDVTAAEQEASLRRFEVEGDKPKRHGLWPSKDYRDYL